MPAMSLDEWEIQLEPELADVQLIGELGLPEQDFKDLTRAIRDLVSRRGPANATRELLIYYPHAFVTYLVFQGVFGYDANVYWPTVCRAVGLPESFVQLWRENFEGIIEDLGLSHEFAGHRYVGAILGHGGIPASSLPEFFEHMLQPSVTRPHLAALTPPELIGEWLTRSMHYRVDKPVLSFLEYGGQVAEDFVERCREMAREAINTGEVPSPEETGLPGTVVEAYREWIAARPEAIAAPAGGLRVRKPRVLVNPLGEGVYLHLPEQRIPATRSRSDVSWRLMIDGRVIEIPVRVRRVDLDLKTEGVIEPIRDPSHVYGVAFCLDGNCEREWSIRVETSDDHPLLVFDPASGALLPPQKRLPAAPLWALLPPGVTLEPERAIRHHFGPLPWGWYRWTACELDLQGLDALVVRTPAGRRDLAVAAQRPASLVGGRRVELLDGALPLYVGRPPRLRIPWRRRSSGSRWRFELHHEWEASPAASISKTLDLLEGLYVELDDAVELPLDHPELLGPVAIGQYRLRVRGPLGSGGEFRFRIVPALDIVGHERLYLPDPDSGAPPVELLVETDPAYRLEPLREKHESELKIEAIADSKSGRCWQITVPPELNEAPIRLVHELGPGRTLFLPLQVPIRRLRWALMLGPTPPAWQHQVVPLSLEELEESEEPYLVIDLPAAPDLRPVVRLGFYDDEDRLLQEVSEPPPGRQARFYRFDLRLVRDTIRASWAGRIRARLTIEGLDRNEPAHLPLLLLRRGIHVAQATVEPIELHGRPHARLTWAPPIPLRSRRVRLWSLSCPWSPPVAIPLPDDAREEHLAPLQQALPAGPYLAEFLVHDPWVPAPAPARPSADEAHVCQALVGDLEERIEQLEAAARAGDEPFASLAERVLLRHALGQTARAHAELLDGSPLHARTAPFDQLFAVMELFEEGAKVLALRLTARVGEMLAALEAGALGRQQFDWFLAWLKRSELRPKPAILLQFLELPDDQLRLDAAQRLIEQGEIAAARTVLQWVDRGELAEAAALDLLDCNPALALQALGEHPLTPAVERLFDALARAHPDQTVLVRPGYWVRSAAGWGRIDRIVTRDGDEAPYAYREQLSRGYRLHVTLRPREDAEPVMVDLATGKIHFLEPGPIFLCGLCRHFASRGSDRTLYYKHKPAAHLGISLSLQRFDSPLRATGPVEIVPKRPHNIWN